MQKILEVSGIFFDSSFFKDLLKIKEERKTLGIFKKGKTLKHKQSQDEKNINK